MGDATGLCSDLSPAPTAVSIMNIIDFLVLTHVTKEQMFCRMYFNS